ncbi:MAG: hypothetical protein HYU64_09735 [Armatimonadetes bacterium]|nr:hypothetical protein [Armatimonadota bacterium]
MNTKVNHFEHEYNLDLAAFRQASQAARDGAEHGEIDPVLKRGIQTVDWIDSGMSDVVKRDNDNSLDKDDALGSVVYHQRSTEPQMSHDLVLKYDPSSGEKLELSESCSNRLESPSGASTVEKSDFSFVLDHLGRKHYMHSRQDTESGPENLKKTDNKRTVVVVDQAKGTVAILVDDSSSTF